MAAIIDGDLVEDPRWGIALKASDGTIIEVIWPAGYYGTHGIRTELVGEGGQVVAETGNHVEIGGGELQPGTWTACAGTIQVVQGP